MNVQVGGNTVSIQVQSSGLGAALGISRGMAAEVATAAASAVAAAASETAAGASETAAAASAASAAATLAGAVLKSANGGDFADPSAVAGNIGGTATGIAVFKAADAATARTAVGADLAANVYRTVAGTGGLTRSAADELADVVTDAGFGTLQQAVTEAALQGKPLYIVDNRVITAAVTVPDGVTIIGAGGAVSTATLAISALILGNDCTVRDLTITGPASLSAEANFDNGNGVFASSKRNITVTNCRITGWQSNGVLVKNCNNVAITDNLFHDNTYTTGSGSDITFYSGTAGARHIITGNRCLSNNSQAINYNSLGGDADATISNNVCVALASDWTEYAHPSTAAGQVRRHAISVSYNGGATAGRTVVSGNICRNTAWTGVYVQNSSASSGVLVSGNYCSNNGYDLTNTLTGGIFVNSLGDELIEGNYIEDFRNTNAGAGGITIGRGSAGNTGLAVRNNVVSDPLGYGMYVSGFLRDTDISGNKIINPGTLGVVISLAATAGDHGGLNLDGNTIIRRSGNYGAIDFSPGGGTTRSRIINNKLLGHDSTTAAAWNTGLNIRNSQVEVRGNVFRSWYYGVGGGAYLTAATRYFSEIVIDDNTFDTCSVGVGLGATANTSTLPICRNIFRNVTAKTSGGILGGSPTLYIAERWGENIVVLERTAAPTTGTYAVGDKTINLTPSLANPVTEWQCITAGQPGTWRATRWLVGSGTTASRPTLPATAVGVQYLDTTLDADGKAIWWNGTAWVDATGATV